MSTLNAVQAIKRKSLHEELAESLQDLIVSGALAPGSKVPERQLCEQFNVSRTPLREALKVLSADGLVVLQPNRGAWVSTITLAELEEVFPILGALEALAGELACQQVTDAEIAEIAAMHDKMVAYYEAKDLHGYFAVNQSIHEAILLAARNPTLIAQHRSLAVRVRRARYVSNLTPERWRQAIDEHGEMIRCLSTRDGKALGLVLSRHLANKFASVRGILERGEALPTQIPNLAQGSAAGLADIRTLREAAQ
jgi:DNA-binding GntR family transcriptional regulator